MWWVCAEGGLSNRGFEENGAEWEDTEEKSDFLASTNRFWNGTSFSYFAFAFCWSCVWLLGLYFVLFFFLSGKFYGIGVPQVELSSYLCRWQGRSLRENWEHYTLPIGKRNILPAAGETMEVSFELLTLGKEWEFRMCTAVFPWVLLLRDFLPVTDRLGPSKSNQLGME